MSEQTIYLEIFQPFAQYRNPFTFYYAQSFPLPPKSTVIGMLQNACDDWYGHKNLEEWKNLKVSIHGGCESIFWNYQQLIKGNIEIENGKLINQGLKIYSEGIKSQRSPVSQQELFNCHLFIFLKGNEILIKKIKDNLENQKKVLYLGRSEDVIFIRKVREIIPIKEKEVEEDIIIKAPTYIKKDFPIDKQKYPVYYIPLSVVFRNNENIVKHKSEITKKTKRDVDFESVIYTGYDYLVTIKENYKIKYELYEIEDKKFKILKDYGWL